MKILNLKKLLIFLFTSMFFILLLNYFYFDVNCSASGHMDIVYVGPNPGDCKSLNDALNAVTDGGTIYIKYHQFYSFDNTTINKNVKIIGIPSGAQLPIINCKVNEKPFITVKEPYSLHLENLYIQSSTYKNIIESTTSTLSLKNIYFKYGYPVLINSPSNSNKINISIDGCKFDGLYPKVILNTPVVGSINFNNCNFIRNSIIIKNSGANIKINNSIFEHRGLKIENFSYGMINVSNNSFIGSSTLIDSYSSSDIILSYNKFPSSGVSISTHDNIKLNANNNWWGSPDGPSISIKDAIICDRWACDEAFNVFNDTYFPPDEGGGDSDELEEPAVPVMPDEPEESEEPAEPGDPVDDDSSNSESPSEDEEDKSEETEVPKVPEEEDPKVPEEPSEPDEDIPTEPEDPKDKDPDYPVNPPEQEEPKDPTEPGDIEEPITPNNPEVPIVPDIPPSPNVPPIPKGKTSDNYDMELYDALSTIPKDNNTMLDLNGAIVAIRIDDKAFICFICDSLKDGKGHWLFNCYIIFQPDGSLFIYILGDYNFVT